MNVPGRRPWACTEAALSSWAESLLQNQPGKLLSRWGAAPKAQLHPLYYMSAQLWDSPPILQFLTSIYFCTILRRPFFPHGTPSAWHCQVLSPDTCPKPAAERGHVAKRSTRQEELASGGHVSSGPLPELGLPCPQSCHQLH